jgi:hypothetical protein
MKACLQGPAQSQTRALREVRNIGTRKRAGTITLSDRGTVATCITARERKNLKNKVERSYGKLCKKYPEVHGKVIDFVQQSVSGGILYVGIQFTDKTVFSLRYASDISIISADW